MNVYGCEALDQIAPGKSYQISSYQSFDPQKILVTMIQKKNVETVAEELIFSVGYKEKHLL